MVWSKESPNGIKPPEMTTFSNFEGKRFASLLSFLSAAVAGTQNRTEVLKKYYVDESTRVLQ